MPRPYIGLISVNVLIEPHKDDKMKRLAQLRKKTKAQCYRDVLGEGLERLAPCLRQSKIS
jgi:hypothetical protein